jgi:hypothetical protein
MTGDRAIKILEALYWELDSIEDKEEMTTLERNIYDRLKPEFEPKEGSDKDQLAYLTLQEKFEEEATS